MYLNVNQVRKLIQGKLGRRNLRAHKGDFGHVFVVAGSRGFSGACRLTSMAALRAGSGLVTVGAPKSLANVLIKQLLEAMWTPLPETRQGSFSRRALKPALTFLKSCDVLAIGPGISRHSETLDFARELVCRSPRPVIIDADGLMAFEKHTNLLKKLKSPAILTPHPGEFRALAGVKPMSDRERLSAALKVARGWRVVIVLKGHKTVVAAPNGNVYVNSTGNAGMATAGSGDVLTGIIAAFLGQGMLPFEAASAGVYVHGLAGDQAAKKIGKISLTAGDILEFLPLAVKGAAAGFTQTRIG